MTYLNEISENILHQLPLTYVDTVCQPLTEVIHLLCTSKLGKNVLLFATEPFFYFSVHVYIIHISFMYQFMRI
jgi:hypothetical protein